MLTSNAVPYGTHSSDPPPATVASPQTWISVAETASLMHLSPSTVIKRIESGAICGCIPDSLPFTYDGKQNYAVLLESLPQKQQYQYQIDHLKPEQYCQLDLVTPRQFYGDLWETQFLQTAEIIRRATIIREQCRSSQQVTKRLKILAEENGLSLSSLYRLLGKPSSKEASLLYLDPIHLSKHLPKTMCLWSAEFSIALYLCEDAHYSHNDIYRELEARRCAIPCDGCIHHPSNVSPGEVVCTRDESFMVIPNNRRTVNRLLSLIPDQVLCYRKEGVRQWRSKFGYFALREKPLLTNDCWQGDHHVFDLFVRVKTYTYKNDKRYESEIAVRPVLTAWMDSATGCFVGWVISVLPNADTIVEAFIRAATFTVGEPFHGLPLSIYTDCGKDYKSNFLEADAPEQYAGLPDDKDVLNRRFNGLGVLKAFGIETLHALPYHPQSKPIERAFRTIEERFISKLPGWCHNSVASRPQGFSKKKDKMLKDKTLLSMEEFVQKFRTEILPGYHGLEGQSLTCNDLPGWLLCYESMTPMQRYESMTKARDITPSWQTLSILKKHHKDGCKIAHYGINFSHTFYKDDSLAFHEGETVSIFYNKVEKPFAPASITVACSGTFLCEAFPAEKQAMTGESASVLKASSDAQNAPLKEMKHLVDRISRSTYAILPEEARKRDPAADPESFLDQKGQMRDEVYGAAVDSARDAVCHNSKNDLKNNIAGCFTNEENPELPAAAPPEADSPEHDVPESGYPKQMSRDDFNSILDFLLGSD